MRKTFLYIVHTVLNFHLYFVIYANISANIALTIDNKLLKEYNLLSIAYTNRRNKK